MENGGKNSKRASTAAAVRGHRHLIEIISQNKHNPSKERKKFLSEQGGILETRERANARQRGGNDRPTVKRNGSAKSTKGPYFILAGK